MIYGNLDCFAVIYCNFWTSIFRRYFVFNFKKVFVSEKTASTYRIRTCDFLFPSTAPYSLGYRCNTPDAESYQVFKCRTTQHKEIKSNLSRDLTLTFDSCLAPRGPNPNPNVPHKETNVYPNPNLTSSYILTQA